MKADCQGRDGDQHPSWEGATKVWCPSGCGVGRDKTLQTREDQETLHDVPGKIFASQWANGICVFFLLEVDYDLTDDLGPILPW